MFTLLLRRYVAYATFNSVVNINVVIATFLFGYKKLVNIKLEKSALKRQQMVGAVAAYLVQYGFRKDSLRSIAANIGVSDRMILYYFDTKERLIADAIELIGAKMAEDIAATPPYRNATVSKVLEALLDRSDNEENVAAIQLWFEMIGLAIRGEAPYRQTAVKLIEQSEEKICDKLRSDQKHRAREVLARLEGELMLRLLSRD